MSKSRLSLAPLAGSLVLATLLGACSSAPPKDETIGWSPNKLFAEAMDERNSRNYDKAVSHFEKLEGRAAGTVLSQQAQLEKAYTHHIAGEQAQAIVALDRFIKLHPSSQALDYALYLKGVVNFNDNLGLFGSLASQDLSERDQKAARNSFEAFGELVTRFPESRYTPDARARMVYIVNALAQYEVHVARYYLSRGAHVAAINRAQAALTDYPEAPALEEALFVMVKSYDALGMAQLRDDAARVMEKNYPKSEYLARGFKQKESAWWKLW
ncbi:outer membrane protein assembly factor BamD [Hydrogenophaga sp. OTU3427]|uniref:outer membrane protein assembly factor BamD n=1 Tax=Hydrogenophaga sp. OTU3427 TaxID=3043856 RepID=UPI00313D1E4B